MTDYTRLDAALESFAAASKDFDAFEPLAKAARLSLLKKVLVCSVAPFTAILFLIAGGFSFSGLVAVIFTLVIFLIALPEYLYYRDMKIHLKRLRSRRDKAADTAGLIAILTGR